MTRILVVEDESGIAFGLRNDLTLEGYAVEVASDGETASRRATESEFDLILLDVMLPQAWSLETLCFGQQVQETALFRGKAPPCRSRPSISATTRLYFVSL
jgi:two-component system response regulator ResD